MPISLYARLMSAPNRLIRAHIRQIRCQCHRPIQVQDQPIQSLNRPSRSRVHSLQHQNRYTLCHHQAAIHHHDMIWDGRISMEPTYWESMRIGWTILWRGVGSVVLLLTLVNALIIVSLPELARTSPSWGALLFPFALTAAIGAFGIMPWLVRHLCATCYPGFRLQLVHEPNSSALESRGKDYQPP